MRAETVCSGRLSGIGLHCETDHELHFLLLGLGSCGLPTCEVVDTECLLGPSLFEILKFSWERKECIH
jgi:hypothetical protein